MHRHCAVEARRCRRVLRAERLRSRLQELSPDRPHRARRQNCQSDTTCSPNAHHLYKRWGRRDWHWVG